MERYVERLLNEWKEHGKIIIAVDWDDTLYPWRFHSKEQINHIWDLLNRCRETGAYVVIFTACDESRYEEIKGYCMDNKLKIDAINETPIPLPYGNNKRKIYANIFLDDRAGLEEAVKILETALYQYRGYLQKENVNQNNVL